MISPLSEEAKRAASLLRRLRDESNSPSGCESDFRVWQAAYEVWSCLVENACDQCLSEYASYRAPSGGRVSPYIHARVCDDCEMKRRAGLGLCTHTLHENPQPCSAERRCDECVSDGICDVCRRNEAPDMDRPCAECEAGRAEALMEER